MGTILVTGGSGNIGSAVVETLRAAGEGYRAGVSDAAGHCGVGAGAATVACDYRHRPQLMQALRGVDRALLLVPFSRDMVAWGRGFVATATACGVEFIVRVSALGAAPDSPSAMGRLHGRIDSIVADSGIDFCILRCNSFMQNFSGHYAGMIRRGRLLLAQGDARFNFIDTRDIGRVVALVLMAPEAFSGRTFDLHGPQCLSNADAVDLIGRATGKCIEYEPITDEQAAGRLARAGAGEWEQAVLGSLDRCFRAGFAVGAPDRLEQLLGRSALRFDEFARAYRDHWL